MTLAGTVGVGRVRGPGEWPMITSAPSMSSAPAGYCLPSDVIAVAVRWYLRYGVSYRDVEELLAERGVEVDHVTVYRWVQRFTPVFIDAGRPARHATGDRWFVDETYVKVAGRWTYLYRAVDQHGRGSTRSSRPAATRLRRGSSSPTRCASARHGRGHHRPGKPIMVDSRHDCDRCAD